MLPKRGASVFETAQFRPGGTATVEVRGVNSRGISVSEELYDGNSREITNRVPQVAKSTA
jgi:hypothetical protein